MALTFTDEELKALYKLSKEAQEQAPDSEEETYNDYYDEYETPISKKTLRAILRKVGEELPPEEREEMEKESLRRKYHTYNNTIDQGVYTRLRKALERLRAVEISYFSMESAEFTKRRVDVYYTSSRYTIGYCHLRKAMRKFRTSRIASAKILDKRYKIPKNFDKNGY